jgi:tetratricopeptide (TPR) repeat protein
LQKDRPASATAYQIYLQANEVGRQWENIPTAIEMYERCVSLDPSYASAWARLGRARWLGDKYKLGSLEGLRAAEEAFQTALRLNPNLTLAHNFYTHVQVDQGRSLDAMKRLLDRAGQRRSDATLCRAGACAPLLWAVAAGARGSSERRLDPSSTSVMHTFMLGSTSGRSNFRADFGYGRGIVLACSTRRRSGDLSAMRLAKPWRLSKLFLTSLRALLEGNREAAGAGAELMKAMFRDPEVCTGGAAIWLFPRR